MAEGKYLKLNGKPLPSDEYWKIRSEEITSAKWDELLAIEKKLAREYNKALKSLRQELLDKITQYGLDRNMNYQDAQKALTPIELETYTQEIIMLQRKAAASSNPFFQSEIERLNARLAVTRLDGIMGQIEAKLTDLAFIEENIVEGWLLDAFTETHYQTLHMLSVGTGLGISFSKINEAAVKTAITMPWSGDMFSQNIWHNKGLLVRKMRQVITQGLIKGESVQKMAQSLNKTMDDGYKNALRIIRTETAHVMTEATAQSYEKSGIVTQYILLATLDNRTSSICKKLDNQIFKLAEKQVGTNCPPLHPNCRSCIAPFINGDPLKQSLRIAKDEENNPMYVPSNMSYEAWSKEYLK